MIMRAAMTEETPFIEDSLTHKVVKDNALIQRARTDLTRTEQKLVNYLVSMIKPSDEDFKTYRISVADFAKLAGIDKTHVSRDFKKIIDGIDKKSFWFEDDEIETKISWILKPKRLKTKGLMEFSLDPDMKKYLIGLKQNFTEYDLYNILSLKTKHAITIYEFLKSYQYKKSIDVNVDEFRDHVLSGELASYKSFGVFKQRVLDAALDDINDNTDLDISYKCLDAHRKAMKTLQGRKVYYLRFIVKPKGMMETFEVYQKTKDRVISTDTDQVPHQLSFDTDNETTDIYDDTTNQKVN